MTRAFTVWFYIGLLLTIYGLLLTGAGIYQIMHPPDTVLASYHATFWTGVVLLLAGLGYLIGYWPRRSKPSVKHDGSDIG